VVRVKEDEGPEGGTEDWMLAYVSMTVGIAPIPTFSH
jgi:hypothetical protein